MTFSILRHLFSIVVLSVVFGSTLQAQTLVDPSKVAPEFRAAAEKRRAEQLKQIFCNQQAIDQKIAPREKLQFITECFDRPDPATNKPSDISATRK